MKQLAIVLVIYFAGAPAFANNVTMVFTGIVNTVTEGGPPAFPKVGDPVSGTIVYDLLSPDTNPAFDTGHYNQTVPAGFVIHAGSLQISMDQFEVNVFNRVPGQGPWDALSFFGNSPPLFGSSASTFTGLGFQAVSRDVLASTALPTTFDLSTIMPVDAAGVIMDSSPIPIWRVDFTLLTLKNVPEPSTLLLAMGVCGVIIFRRHRLTA